MPIVDIKFLKVERNVKRKKWIKLKNSTERKLRCDNHGFNLFQEEMRLDMKCQKLISR
ncbi:MAG: hypothetical protein K0Q49_2369 [Haloplasmataceae bacterium]|jgi:hypothetical protein|nr:hypothetical protein [Haloplasmataceae bacterium]